MNTAKNTMIESIEEELDTEEEEVIMLSDNDEELDSSICINLSTDQFKNPIYDLGLGPLAKFHHCNKTELVLNSEHEYEWVKPEVLKYKSEYSSSKTIELLKNKLVGETETKPLFDFCVDSERVCFGRGKYDSLDFCYFYETFFTRLGMKLPLSKFECEVLNWLNVSPTQLHPNNSWAFVRAFEQLLTYYGLEPSAALFFCFFQLKIGKQVGWVSLNGFPGRRLLENFDQSYKRFKPRFFKIWAVPGEPYFLLNRDDGKPLFPLYWSHHPQPIKEVDETRLPPREFRIVQFLKKLPTLSSVKILAAQNDPKAMDAYLTSMAPKMSKKKMEELLEATKKEGTSHVTLGVPSNYLCCKNNIADAVPLQTTFVVSAPNSKAPTDPSLWAEHLKEFDKGAEDSLWNLSVDRSEIIDEHIMRPADESKFARAGDIGICKALTFHNLRTVAMARHLEHAIIQKDVNIENLKNKIVNLEKELAAEKEKLATAYSKLKKEKNDLAAKYKSESLLWTQQKKKLEDDVVDYQRGFAEQYRDGFENAISQIRILAPNVDVSKVDKYKVVRNGMIVDEEEET